MITKVERVAYKAAYSNSCKSPEGFCKNTIDAAMASKGHRRWYADGLSSENAKARSQKKNKAPIPAASAVPAVPAVRLKANGTPDRRCKGAKRPLAASPTAAKAVVGLSFGSFGSAITADPNELPLAEMREEAAAMRKTRIAAAKTELAEAQERLSKLLA